MEPLEFEWHLEPISPKSHREHTWATVITDFTNNSMVESSYHLFLPVISATLAHFFLLSVPWREEPGVKPRLS